MECKERKKGVVSPVVWLVFDDSTHDLLFALKYGAPVRVCYRPWTRRPEEKGLKSREYRG